MHVHSPKFLAVVVVFFAGMIPVSAGASERECTAPKGISWNQNAGISIRQDSGTIEITRYRFGEDVYSPFSSPRYHLESTGSGRGWASAKLGEWGVTIVVNMLPGDSTTVHVQITGLRTGYFTGSLRCG